MRLLLCTLLLAAPALAQTAANADSCDIGVTPAATLLLPYFEVHTAGERRTTLLTITNASPRPQIAHVTLWTDWAYPVLTFNIFLTGYDVQGIDLYDVIVSGILPRTAPRAGDEPNPRLQADSGCANLSTALPADLATAVRNALTTGVGYAGCTGPIGGNHPLLAVGYATVDVVSYCSTLLPTEPAYYAGASSPLLFDNVLLGDYQQIAPAPAGAGILSSFDAQGNPVVHIRAIPEGGPSGAGGAAVVPTNLPYTFYDRYTPAGARAADRRQPLPSTFAARYIQVGIAGLGTDYKIWREGTSLGLPTCDRRGGSVQRNSVIAVTSVIRFDEHENSTEFGPSLTSPFGPSVQFFPAASRTPTASAFWPPHYSTDIGGWMYMNLSSGSRYITPGGKTCDPQLSAQRAGFGSPCANALPGESGSRATSQNWVTVSMYGVVNGSRLSVDFDAAWLGNGCTPAELTKAIVPPPAVNP